MLKSTRRIFSKFTSFVHIGAEVNALDFVDQKVKVEGLGGIKYTGHSAHFEGRGIQYLNLVLR